MEKTASGPAERRGVLGALNRLDSAIAVVETWVLGGGVLLMAAVMVGHVVGRVLFGAGIPGTYEIAELLIILITFVGISYGVRNARHISMSAFYDQLSGRLRKGMLVAICIFSGALMFYLAWEALGYTLAIFERGRTTGALRLPLWTVYSAVPIGFFLAGTQYWMTAARNLTTEGIYRSFNEEEEYSDVPGDAGIAAEANEEQQGRSDAARKNRE